jgi:hypothetical protein
MLKTQFVKLSQHEKIIKTKLTTCKAINLGISFQGKKTKNKLAHFVDNKRLLAVFKKLLTMILRCDMEAQC